MENATNAVNTPWTVHVKKTSGSALRKSYPDTDIEFCCVTNTSIRSYFYEFEKSSHRKYVCL